MSKEILSWKHAIKFVQNNKINFDYFLSLPTTSPLKSKKDIKKLIKVFCKNRSDITMTVTKSNVSPNFNMVLKKKNGQIKILKSKNRFTLDKVFNLTTVGYIAKTQYIMKNMNLFSGKVKCIEIPRQRAIDIDDIHDLNFAKYLYEKRK